MLEEANNIRMYSWSALFVSLSAIYAYRVYSQNKVSLYVYFVIFSLLAAYSHYFATFTIVLINIILLINQIKNREVTKIKRYLILTIYSWNNYIFLSSYKCNTRLLD